MGMGKKIRIVGSFSSWDIESKGSLGYSLENKKYAVTVRQEDLSIKRKPIMPLVVKVNGDFLLTKDYMNYIPADDDVSPILSHGLQHGFDIKGRAQGRYHVSQEHHQSSGRYSGGHLSSRGTGKMDQGF